MTADDYVEQASEIFVLSDSFIRIRELIDDESSTIDDISEVILLDPALSATVLKLANSPFFSYPGKIDTISKAVLVLGITEVYNLVIAYFTTEAFKNIDANQDYLDEFWVKSVDCALLMKFLGTSLGIVNAERLFILGLLHNLGELVVHQIATEKQRACESLDINLLPWVKQQDILGFTFGECSAELLKQWQLPYSIFAPIRDQDIDDLSQYTVETQLLYIAKRVMSKQQVFKDQNLDYSDLLTKEQLESICIDKKMLENAVDYCDLERLGLLSILNPNASMLY
jgi:HD-like signal output (HDOD) protein